MNQLVVVTQGNVLRIIVTVLHLTEMNLGVRVNLGVQFSLQILAHHKAMSLAVYLLDALGTE